MKPMIRGARPELGLLPFFLSTKAKIRATNMAVLKNCQKNLCVNFLGSVSAYQTDDMYACIPVVTLYVPAAKSIILPLVAYDGPVV